MSKNHKALLTSILAAFFTITAMVIAGLVFGVKFNQSPSVQGLFYYTTDYNPVKGKYVFICPPKPFVIKYDIHKHSGESGDCGGIKPLLKKIVALSGDSVVIDVQGITINGVPVDDSSQLLTDGSGASLPLSTYSGIVPDGHALVLGDHPASFDGRYFGLIKEQWITGQANIIY